jgi:hypothetical protein
MTQELHELPFASCVKWRVIFQLTRNRFLFDIVPLALSGSATNVVWEISRQRHSRWPALKEFVNRVLLCRTPVVGIASLASVCI